MLFLAAEIFAFAYQGCRITNAFYVLVTVLSSLKMGAILKRKNHNPRAQRKRKGRKVVRRKRKRRKRSK